MNLLHTIGLMTRAEHEAASFRVQCQAAEALTEIENLKAELRAADNLASGWESKFKRAVADLEKQAGEMRVTDGLLTDAQMEAMELRHEIECLKSTFNQRLADSVQDYEADALAMRRKRQMDRDRRKGNG